MCVTDDSPPLMFLLNVRLVNSALASPSHGCADVQGQVDPIFSTNLPCLTHILLVRKQEEGDGFEKQYSNVFVKSREFSRFSQKQLRKEQKCKKM